MLAGDGDEAAWPEERKPDSLPAGLPEWWRLERLRQPQSLRGRVYTHCGAIFCCMGLPRASPVNPPKQAQAATDGATMCVYLAP